jgi:hypothetical protein
MRLSPGPIGIGMGVCGGDCYRELPRIPQSELLRTASQRSSQKGPFPDVGLIEVVLWLLAQIVFYVMDHRAAGRGAIARRQRKGYPAARRQSR